jgi:membrane protease YdiL (CAAX protease family)
MGSVNPRRISVRSFGPVLPYAAVAVGLYGFRNAWAVVALYQLPILLAVLWRRPPGLWRTIRSGWHRRWALGLAAYSSMAGVLIYAVWPLAKVGSGSLGEILQQFGLRGVSWCLYAVYFVTLHPLSEEIFWRVYIGQGESYRLDLLFVGYHVLVLHFFVTPAWILASVIVLFASARFWGRVGERLGGLSVPFVSHVVADVSIIAAVSLLAFGG